MVADFRRRFWISLILTLPIVALSHDLWHMLGLAAPVAFSGVRYLLFAFSSIVFFYLSLLPDIALVRDNVRGIGPWQRKMYEVLALGWQGRPEQFHRLEKVLDGMAIFMTMLVVTVHTVVSWMFGMTLQPGWHSSIFGPYFVIAAVYSGKKVFVKRIDHWMVIGNDFSVL